jgi:6-phosphogluconolactonase
MKILNIFNKKIAIASLTIIGTLTLTKTVLAGTFVYVSNAQDGNIRVYKMQSDGNLQTGIKVKVANTILPMVVSNNKHFLYVASLSKPFAFHSYAINPKNGVLTHLSTVQAADSFPYISLDKTGSFLLSASYGGNLVSVNAVGRDGRVVAPPLQVIPVGRNAHSIRLDESNKFAYVTALGSDQVFQFTFNSKIGKLTSNTPAVILMKPVTGPRHFVTSSNNKFLYLLSEMVGTITIFALDGNSGLLTKVSQISGLPLDTKLTPGMIRDTSQRNTDNDIWAADIHLTSNGKFLYTSERTNSNLNAFRVNSTTGQLTYLSSVTTELVPRGFAIDPKGRFLIASGEKSETISVYAINQDNGSLQPLGKYLTGKGANWIEIVSFD